MMASHNVLQVVAAFYLFALTANHDSIEFKDKKNKLMAIFAGENDQDMVKKQGNINKAPVGATK
jgi:hypothetical protein